MNPPSALQGAMGRDRKPFTYTPGGLDLSEIKSERMAKRLMRNAMNQGVPEQPPQVQSPTTPTTPIAVPNYNALPVQVFPTFNLPANPKSLLRTRSTPDRPRDPPAPKAPPPTQNTNTCKPSGMDQLRETLNNITTAPTFTPVDDNYSSRPMPTYEFNSNNRPSMYELNTPAIVTPNLARSSYGSDAYTAPILPEICYDAEYCRAPPRNSNGTESINKTLDTSQAPSISIKDNYETVTTDFTIKPLTDIISVPVTEIKPEDEGIDDDQRTVKVVKKQTKSSEKKSESENQKHNGDHNGDAEAEMVVKLPAKKSAAKTETNVEVVKKTLPDGSVEETKTTTTTTTVDGKTSISTKTETTIIPKEPSEEIEEEEEEETTEVQDIEENGQSEEETTTTVVVKKSEAPVSKETIVKKEERSETTTTKSVVVIQQEEEPEEVEEEEEEVEEEEVVEETEPETTTVVIKKAEEKIQKQEEKKEILAQEKQVQKQDEKVDMKQEKNEKELEEEEEEEEEEFEEEKVVKVEKPVEKVEPTKKEVVEQDDEEEVEEEEEYEKTNETKEKTAPKPEPKQEKPSEPVKDTKDEQSADDESEYTEEEIESEKEDLPKEASAPTQAQAPTPETPKAEPQKEAKPEGKEEEIKEPKPEPTNQSIPQPAPQPEQKVPFREPSIPLEKVEDVEIKPIGAVTETISKTHTERTEITSTDKPSGGLSSLQTDYNRIENIVTVNRTTKTLDHSYEQITQQGIPTVKTYFPPGRERVSTSPQPARPYQPFYTPPQPQAPTERRHSLLLERLSMERQMPSDIYQKQTSLQQQYNNQAYEQQRQWSQEPQSEVVNDPNIKPSTITNQQWYQQSRKENVIFNNVSPSTPAVPSQQWSQPQPQVQHQPPPQPQPQYQSPYTENSLHESSKCATNTYQQSSYPSYTPAPAPAPAPSNWASSNVGSTLPNSQSNQYSYLNKTSSENYQQNQQYSSSYVPPPWEQDPNYVAPELAPQNFYQPPPSSNTFSPSSTPSWKPTPPAGKFSKPAPKSYIPPAPNQSFVKSANTYGAMPPKHPGSKTYYSEYERRYITVPESTYIPADAKFQPQPDPSPQYYYDNNEPNESVEHQWRKELREFTEKTQTQTQTETQTQTQTQTQHSVSEQTSVHPPWEGDPKYTKVPPVQYTPTTPSWSQTVRPQSYRERSFESEYVGSNEWAKTNTLGRSRPLSTYVGSNVEAPPPERQRGVSVDRYNPNKYQSPLTIPYDSEHGPVQAHTLDPTHAPHRGYHNPNVPAYHARASAEPREQQPTVIPKPSNWGGERATPIQSRSFKYLQWITGTED